MTIWAHANFLDCQLGSQLARSTTCLYCTSTLIRDHEDESKIETYETLNWGFSDKFTTTAGATIAICPGCGWWKYAAWTNVGGRSTLFWDARVGQLIALDPASSTLSLQEVRNYLMARYDARFDIHPRVFEELVASVYSDLGYCAVATAYSGDGGIDVIMRDAKESIIGV